jgi:2-keto-3-deoxy-L-rhamnonate aldolase RhmA
LDEVFPILFPWFGVTQNEAAISRALDVGAMGIIMPRIHSPEEARSALQVIKFTPTLTVAVLGYVASLLT